MFRKLAHIDILVVAACLPFKPCTTLSPVTPVGSSGGKKRRVTPSNSGARCAAKNMRVDLKKAAEKSSENPIDDKVVSSSCEIECSSTASLSTLSKTLPSRSSLDYFVHTTQKLEVTTSSTDGDLVDLTGEYETASEEVALSSTSVPDVADVMPATEASEPVADECNIEPVTQLICVSATVPAEVTKVNAKSKKDSCTSDPEVGEAQCSQQKDAQNFASTVTGRTPDTDSAGSICAAVPDNRQDVQEIATSATTSLDGEKTSNDDVGESSLDKSSSSAADDDADAAESPVCDNTDKSDMKLNEPTVVVMRLAEENKKIPGCGEKSEVSTTSVNVNGDIKVNTPVGSKPKVRNFNCMTLRTTFYSTAVCIFLLFDVSRCWLGVRESIQPVKMFYVEMLVICLPGVKCR